MVKLKHTSFYDRPTGLNYRLQHGVLLNMSPGGFRDVYEMKITADKTASKRSSVEEVGNFKVCLIPISSSKGKTTIRTVHSLGAYDPFEKREIPWPKEDQRKVYHGLLRFLDVML